MVPSVVPSLEVPGGQMGPRGTAGNDKSLRCSISVAVPPGPMLLPLETPCCCPSKPLVLCLETPGAVPRNPRSAAPRNPWGQILRPKFSSFGDFQAPPTKTSYTTLHYYPKFEVQEIKFFLYLRSGLRVRFQLWRFEFDCLSHLGVRFWGQGRDSHIDC